MKLIKIGTVGILLTAKENLQRIKTILKDAGMPSVIRLDDSIVTFTIQDLTNTQHEYINELLEKIQPKKRKPTPKWVQYAAQITDAIGELINNEDNDNCITLDEENLTDFFHALMNAAPTMIYNNITGAGTDQLGCNHVANRLCVQYRDRDGKTKKDLDQFDERIDHTQKGRNEEE